MSNQPPAADDNEPTGLEVAIVGMAARFPGADDLASFWRILRDGVEAITHWTPEELAAAGVPADWIDHPSYVRSKAVLDGFDTFDARLFGMTPREAEILDPQHRIFLECVWASLEDAGCDPARFPGPIGLYGGMSSNSYWADNLYKNPALDGSVSFRQTVHGTGKDYLATRTAYKLDLRGPSMTVQTACSSALVATHLACQALIGGDCDLALAGGVTVRLPQHAGYWYQEGGVGSSDGHCRAYDAKADGTVDGSGVGVIVLKRLDEALADNDPIHAVIRGTALTNDGGGRVGYTAPSVDGQARAIRAALEAAEVAPETITYVEGHGAGTPLGDPTEVEALRRALETPGSAQQPCALGSVKTNIGHLDAAAGVAGLIKTVLSLENRSLPPSLNFERANPEIPFEGSRFYVNTTLRPWENGNGPRRAGVSSFGIGGTNAHVILQEAPDRSPSPPAQRKHQLIALSGKSTDALRSASERLATHLEAHPELPLADVAYTLGLGRRQLERRQILVASDSEDVCRALAEQDPSRVLFGTSQGARPVTFLLAGVGDQYPGMARDLYREETGFRDAFDRCADLLEPEIGLDIRTVLFATDENPEKDPGSDRSPTPSKMPSTSEPDLRAMLRRAREAQASPDTSPGTNADGETPDSLADTWMVQPIIFAIDYALAQLWMSLGVRPASMLGFSLGEYVAACLAGVFSLEDGLRLVAARARLIDDLPRGVMVAVPLGSAAVVEHLSDDLAIAVEAAPALTIVAGPEAAVAAFERRVQADDVSTQRLPNTHAFHSTMMMAVAKPLEARFAEVALELPKIPYISNVTGTFVTDEEATDPAFWVRHTTHTVRFADGLETVLADPRVILLEVGPGRSLSSFARQIAAPEQPTLSSLRDSDDPTADGAFLMNALGRLWLHGVEIDWSGLFAGEQRQRVRLPAYPFERTRYWIDPQPAAGSRVVAHEEGPNADTAVAVAGTGTDTAPGSVVDATPPASLALHQRPDLPTRYEAPEGDNEARLVPIWQDLMGVAPIGVHDNFFDLGGHSLLATLLVARIEQTFGVALPLRSVSETPTPRAMAADLARVVDARADDATSVEVAAGASVTSMPMVVPDPANHAQPFPLTDIQEAYWIGQTTALVLGKMAAHSYRETDNYELDVRRYERVWRLLIERHEMLRAVVDADGRQRVLTTVPRFDLPVLDLRDQGPEEVEAELARVRSAMSHQTTDTSVWPLFDIRATVLPEDRVRIHWSINVLIMDAWSFQILSLELQKLYQEPDEPLPPLELSFRDYVIAEHALRETPLYSRAETYWKSRVPSMPPPPELPLAVAPASLRQPRFVRRSRRLDAAVWSRLKARASRAELTPTAFLVAVFSEVLAVWSKTPRFTLNLTLYNRLPLHPQVQDIVGDFTSLNLMSREPDDDTFADRARAVQRRLWDDLDHRAMSGVRVMRELARAKGSINAGSMPVVFTSVLTLTRMAQEQIAEAQKAYDEEADAKDAVDDGSTPEESSPEKDKKRGGIVYGVSQTPQVWMDHQVSEWNGELATNWDVIEDLFPSGLIDTMFEVYFGLLGRLADDDALWEANDLDLLPAADRDLVATVNATEGEVPEGLLHEPFLARARENPDHPAIISSDRRMTYGELDAASAELAQRLVAMGAARNRLIAVVLDKGWQQVVSALAVLRAGAAYLPIDPDLPTDRLHHLLRHGEIEIALTREGLEATVAWPSDVAVIAVDSEDGGSGDGDIGIDPERDPLDLAYVIYTSGSTGEPKGVVIDHRGALNTIVDINDRFEVTSSDRIFGLSALSFDLSVYDIFGTLAAGATVVLPAPGSLRDPAAWAEQMEAEGVTVWDSVPALKEMLVEYLESREHPAAGPLRCALLSGDWVPVNLPERIRGLWPDAQVISLGGATEASIWSILYPIEAVSPEWSSIPYGHAMRNQRFYVLDERLEPCPLWVPGELMIGGIGLAKGYWRDEERTNKAFIVHPKTGERLYRTGDLGRLLPDGEIEFLGREDLQVKVGGYRIELGEIEAVMAQHPDLGATAVVALGARRGAKRLVAYAVPADRATIDVAAVLAFLATKLPGYMVPGHLVSVASLPLSANGKVDRKALETRAARDLEAGTPTTVGSASTSVDEGVGERIRKAIREVLSIEQIDPQASLLELGAASIEMVKLANLLERAFDFRPEMERLFEVPTVAELIAYFEARAASESGQSAPSTPSTARTDEPLPSFLEVIQDPDERERHKHKSLGLRRINGDRSGPAVDLPAADFDAAAQRPYLERRSVRRFLAEPLEIAALGGLLSALRRALVDGKPKYRYGSAGGSYPLQAYLYVKPDRVEGLSSGFSYYDPVDHRLVPLSSETLEKSPFGWVNADGWKESAFAVFLVAELQAIGPLYGLIARDYSLIEAGLIAQLLETDAPSKQIGLYQVGYGGVDREAVAGPLGLAESHSLVHALIGGPLDPVKESARAAHTSVTQAWEEGAL